MVFKDKNRGTWRFRIWATNPFTGERKRLFGTPTLNLKEAAVEMERAHVQAFEMDPAKRPAPTSLQTVAQVADAYLKNLRSNPELAESYLQKVELNLGRHIVPAFPDKRLIDIREADLKTFKLELQNKVKRGAEGPKLKPRTVKDILRVFYGVFVYALEKNLVSAIPRFPKAPKAFKGHPDFLSFQEVEAVLAAAETPFVRLLILFAIKTGVRAGEQMAMRWEDLKLSPKGQEYVLIHRAFKLDKLGQPKGKASRVVPLSPELLAALDEYRTSLGGQARGLIFTPEHSPRATHKFFSYHLEQTLKRARIERHLRWHDLRHTFGSHHASLGTDLRQVQEWMGHVSINTTEIYAHLCPSRGTEAMSKMEGQLAKVLAQSAA